MLKRLLRAVQRFVNEERGGNTVEYSLLAGLVAVAFWAGSGALGISLGTYMNSTSGCVGTPEISNCEGFTASGSGTGTLPGSGTGTDSGTGSSGSGSGNGNSGSGSGSSGSGSGSSGSGKSNGRG